MEMSTQVIRPEYHGKVTSITEFRRKYANGVTYQAIQYAIENDKIDYIQIADRTRLIVLTDKTLAYKPNDSPSRAYVSATVRKG